ncbi:MAG: choice-of-anchor D domain-containing protein [Planctomycetes bacterium]|nr:choice-of-anchor D domain-containing protein [Planctomycetota bacterium]
MRTVVMLALCLMAGALSSQSVSLLNSSQPAASPVAPSTANHPVLRFGVFRATGDPASNLSQIAITMNGTAVATSDWTAIDLYADLDHSGTVTGGDVLLGSTSTTLAGKAVISGIGRAIPAGLANADDLLVVVDVAAGATAGRTFQMVLTPADVVVSAGTVSNFTTNPSSNTQTVTINNGCEIDVRFNSVSQPSSTTNLVYVGQVPAATPQARTFVIHNTGTGTLTLSGSPLVAVVFTNNCAVTLTTAPTASIGAGGQSSFELTIDPNLATIFSFRISIASNDFDENPYILIGAGTGGTDPYMTVLQGSTPIAVGSAYAVGSQTAGVNTNLTFTIRNDGFGDLNLTSTPPAQIGASTNATATIQTQPTSPVAQGGATTTFVVQYKPDGAGAFSFTVQVTNNDAFHNPYSFFVQGTAPAVTGTQLTVWRDPIAPNANVVFGTQPIVAITNSIGAVDTGNNTALVTAAITTGTGTTGAVLSGTVTRQAAGGYVNFNDLKINLQGTGYSLTFTSGSFGSATSGAFDVGPLPPAPPPPPSDNKKKDDDGGCSTGETSALWPMLAALCLLAAIGLRQRNARPLQHR